MELRATQPASSSSTAAYPPWVMLEPYADVDTTDSYTTADDANTLVVARTSTGHPVGVSLHLQSPPAESRVRVHFPHCSKPRKHGNIVIAAHGDSVLIQVIGEEGYDSWPDYFVYNAGTTGTDTAQPPSLSLLPPCYLYYLNKDSTGLLRRGKDELVVAQLKVLQLEDKEPTEHVAELLLFRSGSWWTIRWPRINCLGIGIEEDKFLSTWYGSRSVIPVGDSMLCWVNMSWGLIFSDLFEESPGLAYVPLPADACCTEHFSSSRNVCVTAGGTVKFVNIFARCCCGGAGGCKCRHSDHAYLIKTWTLRIESRTWVLDGMMDATELWALDAYKSLPRVQVGFPVVSMDEPHNICFEVCDKNAWFIMVDMRSKILRYVYRCPIGKLDHRYPGKLLLPSKVSYYFNCYPGSSNQQTEIEPQQPVAIPAKQLAYDASNSKLLPSGCNTLAEPGVHASEILAALQEISSYGLEGDHLRKAISILSRGNGCQFRSYLGIPKSLRKDWLLMTCEKQFIG